MSMKTPSLSIVQMFPRQDILTLIVSVKWLCKFLLKMLPNSLHSIHVQTLIHMMTTYINANNNPG